VSVASELDGTVRMSGEATVTFWFDPVCPFTWRTSRWVRDVASRPGRAVRWAVMSLAILNDGKEIPERFREGMRQAPRAHRVLVAADQRYGQDAIDRLYTALGERLHHGGERLGTDLLVAAIADAGLPVDLIDAADDSSLDPAVRASHDEGQARVGTESGSPVTAIDDHPGFFGPVVVPVPEPDTADRLFEALRLLSGVPQFSELKRARNPF